MVSLPVRCPRFFVIMLSDFVDSVVFLGGLLGSSLMLMGPIDRFMRLGETIRAQSHDDPGKFEHIFRSIPECSRFIDPVGRRKRRKLLHQGPSGEHTHQSQAALLEARVADGDAVTEQHVAVDDDGATEQPVTADDNAAAEKNVVANDTAQLSVTEDATVGYDLAPACAAKDGANESDEDSGVTKHIEDSLSSEIKEENKLLEDQIAGEFIELQRSLDALEKKFEEEQALFEQTWEAHDSMVSKVRMCHIILS